MERHVREVHEGKKDPNPKRKCPICNKVTSKKRMKEHIAMVHEGYIRIGYGVFKGTGATEPVVLLVL